MNLTLGAEGGEVVIVHNSWICPFHRLRPPPRKILSPAQANFTLTVERSLGSRTVLLRPAVRGTEPPVTAIIQRSRNTSFRFLSNGNFSLPHHIPCRVARILIAKNVSRIMHWAI